MGEEQQAEDKRGSGGAETGKPRARAREKPPPSPLDATETTVCVADELTALADEQDPAEVKRRLLALIGTAADLALGRSRKLANGHEYSDADVNGACSALKLAANVLLGEDRDRSTRKDAESEQALLERARKVLDKPKANG